MHRNPLLKLLWEYLVSHQQEQDIINHFLQFVSSQPNCFERTLQIGHITGSAWLVNATGTHVLLTHHRKLDKWLQLGGHADGDSDLWRVVLRELREESGLRSIFPVFENIFDLDIHHIPRLGNETEHLHYDVRFAMQATESTRYMVSEESHDLSWFAIKNLQAFTQEESLLRMARKWLTHVGHFPRLRWSSKKDGGE